MDGEGVNYYQHHIGDFIRDTARLTDAQSMAYLRLIWIYYENESPIENDIDAIAFRIGANALDVHQILKHFFFLHDDGAWHQSRCDKEILAYRKKSEKAKKSAKSRWDNANAMRTQCERNANERILDANQEPITNNQEKEKRDKDTLSSSAEKQAEPAINAPASLVPRGENANPPTTASQERQIFEYWQAVMGKPRAVLDDKRRRSIKARLKDGYTPEQIMMAVDGCRGSPHNMGQNDRKTAYNDIELICRNAPNLERFISISQQAAKQTNALDDFLFDGVNVIEGECSYG